MVRIMLLIFSKSYANVGGVISRTLVTFSISCEKIMFVTEILIRKIELWINEKKNLDFAVKFCMDSTSLCL